MCEPVGVLVWYVCVSEGASVVCTWKHLVELGVKGWHRSGICWHSCQ